MSCPFSRFPAAAALVLLMATAAPAVGQPAGVTITHGADGPTLHRVDLTTGELTPIGPLGLPDRGIESLTFLPTGELVAVDGSQDELVRIDPATGQGTAVGGLGADASFNADLAADACGRLWMVTPPASGGPVTELYRIDPVTGAAELLGTLPTEVYGLAAAGETLYGLTGVLEPGPRIVEIDPETLAVTEVAVVEDASFFQAWALDLGGAGELVAYGGLYIPFPIPPLPRILRFDLSGEISHVISYPDLDSSRRGLAVAPPPGQCVGGSPLPIPTASPLGLAALAVLLAAAGALTLGRCRG